MSNGWIKLHRSILENEQVTKDSDTFRLWVTLLLMATHKPRTTIFNGEQITTKPGQLITGKRALAARTGISESKVYRELQTMVRCRQIELQSNHRNSLITIVKWHTYQDESGEGEPQSNHNRTTSEPEVNTYKKKEERSKKKEKENTRASARTYSPEFQAFWEKYPKSRRKEKPKAYDAWVKLSPGDRQQAIARLPDWIAAHHDDSQPQYTVYPERYLKRRRWEDEVDAPKRRWGEKDRR